MNDLERAGERGEGRPGDVIDGRFRLERVVGEGGMSVVWAATRLDGDELVAVKISRHALHGDARARRRVLREVRAANAVDHPNALRASELIEMSAPAPGDLERIVPIIIMPLLSGETLAARLERAGRLAAPDAAALLVPVVSAVGTAHARGVVHRDLKPENIFIVHGDRGESPKVLDFGVAKLRGRNWLVSTTLTRPGVRVGTPRYMAPEQAMSGQPVDPPADVWALGTILYECLSGVLPIEGDTVEAVIDALLGGAITPLGVVAPWVPDDVASVVDRMLIRDVAGRPGLREVAAVLGAYTDVRAPDFGPPETETGGNEEEEEREEEAPVAQRGEGLRRT